MPGRTGAVVIRLNSKRRRKLEQIVRAATSPQRLVLRARIVLAPRRRRIQRGDRR